ncbi:MAG: hypothetical protein K8I30_18440 [Anaerolineae bacterium]|nr:hypothetical protein [Anaerolineae bacterium]
MDNLLGFLDKIGRNFFGGAADHARDQASYSAASAVERATFGRVFGFIEGALFLVMLFGCMFISNFAQNQTLLLYGCGILWVIPFIVVGGVLVRFRNSLFVRIRGMLSRFMGG